MKCLHLISATLAQIAGFILTALYCCLGQVSFSQSSSYIEWQKSVGGSGTDISLATCQTSDGGYIMAGYTTTNNNGDVTGYKGNDDFWVVKISESGTIQWQKTYGGYGQDRANAIVQTPDGGYIVAGMSMSNNGDVTGNHGDADCWIIKLGSSGDIQWQKSYGGSGLDDASDIKTTSDGGYIVVGYSYSSNGDVSSNKGGADWWMIKIDASGNLQWQKSIGGSGADFASAVLQTSDGGYILAGPSMSNDGDVSVNKGSWDYWVVKLNSSGTIQWEKSYGGNYSDYPTAICPANDGGYIIAGYSTSTNGDITNPKGNEDFWLVKINGNGVLQWQKSYGGAGLDQANYINPSNDGGYWVSGYTQSSDGLISENHGSGDYWVVKIDENGNLKGQKSLGGTGFEMAYFVKQATDGGIVLAGYSNSNNGHLTENKGGYDYWIVKLNQTALTIAIPLTTVASWGANPVTGNINRNVWLAATQPVQYVRRHYEVTPENDAAIATGRVTLYFTNQDFKDFNTQIPVPAKLLPDIDDPATVNERKANLLIEKIGGISSDGSGLPHTYPGASQTIDPDDQDIIWNTDGYWEVSFNVTGFSGFFVKTQAAELLPVTFGDISAVIKGGVLYINFSTLTETNNDHFIIEASSDGKNFKETGTVLSTAKDGNSDVPVHYTFSFNTNNLGIAGMAGFGLFALLCFAARRNRGLFAVAAFICAAVFVSCNKTGEELNTGSGENIYIRIAQVDKDGTKTYSKVVKAVQE